MSRWNRFDDGGLDPQQRRLRTFLVVAGAILVATALIPFDRYGGGAVNLFQRAGSLKALELLRVSLPSLVGASFLYLAFFTRLPHGRQATIAAVLLTLMVAVGVNMFEILRVARPPIAGDGGVRLFGMRSGTYFPREDTLHLLLLGSGLAILAAAGRYRSQLQSSRIGSYGLMVGCALILAYYIVPYKSWKVPVVRNVQLTMAFGDYANKLDTAQEQLGDILKRWPRSQPLKGEAFKQYFETSDRELYTRMLGQGETTIGGPEAVKVIQGARRLRMTPTELATFAPLAGQVKLSAWYFLAIYCIPALLVLLAIGGFKESRFRGHRLLHAKAAQVGSITYLLAFLLPMLAKEGMKSESQAKLEQLATGEKWLGFWPNFRAYLLLAVFLSGFAVTLSIALRQRLEPEASDAGLPASPLEWTDDPVEPAESPQPTDEAAPAQDEWNDNIFS